MQPSRIGSGFAGFEVPCLVLTSLVAPGLNWLHTGQSGPESKHSMYMRTREELGALR
jgi:hypothetical protein